MSNPAPPRRWRVQIHKRPEKALRRIPQNLRQRIRASISALEENPRPSGCRKLSGYQNLYRLRVGDWRIVYAIKDDQLVVLIIEVSPRSGAYKAL